MIFFYYPATLPALLWSRAQLDGGPLGSWENHMTGFEENEP